MSKANIRYTDGSGFHYGDIENLNLMDIMNILTERIEKLEEEVKNIKADRILLEDGHDGV